MNDSFGPGFRIFALMTAGALAAVSAPALLAWLSGPELPAMWWASRSFGLLAYVAAWLSTLFGVLIAGRADKSAWLDRAVLLELHSRWSVATLITTALHVLLVVGDSRSGVSPLAALVPLASRKLEGPMALGTLATWGLLLIAATTAAYRNLPRWVWRAVHASAFGTFVLALAHGLAAGTDSAHPLVRGLYAGTSAVLLFAVVRRVVSAVNEPTESPRRPGSSTTANPNPSDGSPAVRI